MQNVFSGPMYTNGPGFGLAIVAVLTATALFMIVWWAIPHAPQQAPPLTSVAAPHAAAMGWQHR